MKYVEKTITLIPRDEIISGNRWDFPIDMLRYDHCFPASEEDSGKIIDTFQRRREVTTNIEIRVKHFGDSKWKPTEGRWISFGWKVKEEY